MSNKKRLRTRVPIRFDVSVSTGEKAVRTEMINISLNGILCTSSPFFKINDLCLVTVGLSNDTKIVIESKIIRAGEKDTAISFISMDDESFRHLRRMIQYNAGDADIIDEELNKRAFQPDQVSH